MADTLKDLIGATFQQFPERTAIRVLRQADQQGDRGLRYVPMTYRQLQEQRDRVAKGLHKMGVTRGQRVGILTDGGLEPVLVFLACDVIGASSAPFCNKLPDDHLLHVMDRAEPVVLFTDAKSYEQVARVLPRMTKPPQVVLTEGQQEGTTPFFALIQSGADAPLPDVVVGPEDETKVIFTSGSSGMPKGVAQTHRSIVSNVRQIWETISLRDEMVFFKSAPDYHTMGILNIYYPLAKGWTLDLARSPDRVLTDLRYSEPHAFLTVPLVMDKVYGNVRKEIAAGGRRGRLIARAVRAKQRISRGEASIGDYVVHGVVGRKVVGKIREKLSQRVGSRLELLIVGAAKADPEALDFFQDVLDITTFEGYGTTESSSLIAANNLKARKTGTVGVPFYPAKVMLDGKELGSVDPQAGSVATTNGRAGELWVSGPNVMLGYLGEPEETEKTLVKDADGNTWYRTGDLCSIDDEGFLSFHGRLGRQFKLRNGEFVNPEHLERVYSRVSLVDHVLVCGDQSRKFPLPVVNVNLEEARAHPDMTDLPADDDLARQDHRLAALVREAMLKEATDAGVPAYERPQRVVVASEPFSEEAGTLTRGLKKLVPKAIAARFETDIAAAYEGV